MRDIVVATALLGSVCIAAGCGKAEEQPAVAGGGQISQAVAAPGQDPRGAIFVAKGCPQCHSISALEIKSQAEVGPDLTTAYADVQSRFGVKLEDFLRQPTGTMQVVLSSMVQLTPAERDSIVHILEQLHEEAAEKPERGR